MRAGLLSEPQVIRRINEQFVSTAIIIDDAEELAKSGDPLAETAAEHWEFPLDMMFLSPEGALINKLNSFRDLRDAHPEVGHPPEGRGRAPSHLEVLMNHLDTHFPHDDGGSQTPSK